MDIDAPDLNAVASVAVAATPLPPTTSGRIRTFLTPRYAAAGLVPSSRTMVPHIPIPPTPIARNTSPDSSHVDVEDPAHNTSLSPENGAPPPGFVTAPNHFGVYRVYPHKPTHDPDATVPTEALGVDGAQLSRAPDLAATDSFDSAWALSGFDRAFANYSQFLIALGQYGYELQV